MLDIRDESDAHGSRGDARDHASGNWNPSWEPFAKLDPSWTEKVIAMAIAPAVSGALDTKTIELIRIALDASCVHLNAPGIRRHIRRALQAGATKAEITAVLQIASLQGLEQHVRRRADPARRTAGRRSAAERLTSHPTTTALKEITHELHRRLPVPREPGQARDHLSPRTGPSGCPRTSRKTSR